MERGESGYEHWQLVIATEDPVRRTKLSAWISGAHFEKTRSKRALEYVWKDDTRIGQPFELGAPPRNDKRDWAAILKFAEKGEYSQIPPDVLVRYYSSIRRITSDNLVGVAVDRTATVFWGRTGTGKSRRAWDEAGLDAYPKDPLSKWWDGYRGQKHVVVDEFRGVIAISHLLRWLDRYPVLVEVKGGSVSLAAEKIWFTSNLDPRKWYPELDSGTLDALLRRVNIVHFS